MCSADPFRPEAMTVEIGPSGDPVWLRGGRPRELLDLADECAWLAAFHEAAEPLRDVPPERFFAVLPERSAWSAGQHFFHVLLANELALRNVELIGAGTSSFLKPAVDVGLVGALVLPDGSMPRGLGRPPRAVTPPARPNPQIVWQAHAGNVATLERIRADLPRLAAARSGVPHQDLGVLGAGHWIRFAAIHGWHHLRIVREILAA